MMTKFEKTRLISARALQIAQGAPAKGKGKPSDIAKEEFEEGKIPLEVDK
jgi:DNA-directed RNA polymerase subunit K/omega